MKKVDKKSEIRNCSGCMACKNVCPANCISFKENYSGFKRIINKSKCMNCGMCDEVCHLVHNRYHYPYKAYIAWNKNIGIHRRSTSGGVAVAVYEYCVKHNIVSVGVRYNKNLQAVYDVIQRKEDIKYYIGSKYVYSHMENIYKNIKERAQKGEKIVFIGLPCHVMSLKNYLQVECDNIIYIDLVCTGVCSEKMLLQHLGKYVEKNRITTINFREKGNQYGITLRDERNKLIARRSRYTDEYMIGFCEGITYFEECYACKFARPDRCSDLTIKDYSGLREGILQREKNGLSNILVNTEKAC